MKAPENCPECGTGLRGDPIPQHLIDEGCYAPSSTHYRREIGYSAHDYTQFFICPDCGGTWNRWDEEHPYWERAEKLRAKFDAEVERARR